jgi:hypothetical protein
MVLINCTFCTKQVDVSNRCHKFCSTNCKIEKRRFMARRWKQNNKEKNKTITFEWKQNNRNHISNYNREYSIENRIAIYEQHNHRIRERRQTDLNFRLACNYRGRMKKFLKKGRRNIKYLGCSYDFLMKWFSFLEPEAILENYGYYGWHIDHVIPCSLFNLEIKEEISKCFHWTNIQPLLFMENLSKRHIISEQDIIDFEFKLHQFCLKEQISIPLIYNRFQYIK